MYRPSLYCSLHIHHSVDHASKNGHCVVVDEENCSALVGRSTRAFSLGDYRSFEFDHIAVNNPEGVYHEVVSPLIDGMLDGTDGIVFLYGPATRAGSSMNHPNDTNKKGLFEDLVKTAAVHALERQEQWGGDVAMTNVSYYYKWGFVDALDPASPIHDRSKGMQALRDQRNAQLGAGSTKEWLHPTSVAVRSLSEVTSVMDAIKGLSAVYSQSERRDFFNESHTVVSVSYVPFRTHRSEENKDDGMSYGEQRQRQREAELLSGGGADGNKRVGSLYFVNLAPPEAANARNKLGNELCAIATTLEALYHERWISKKKRQARGDDGSGVEAALFANDNDDDGDASHFNIHADAAGRNRPPWDPRTRRGGHQLQRGRSTSPGAHSNRSASSSISAAVASSSRRSAQQKQQHHHIPLRESPILLYLRHNILDFATKMGFICNVSGEASEYTHALNSCHFAHRLHRVWTVTSERHHLDLDTLRAQDDRETQQTTRNTIDEGEDGDEEVTEVTGDQSDHLTNFSSQYRHQQQQPESQPATSTTNVIVSPLAPWRRQQEHQQEQHDPLAATAAYRNEKEEEKEEQQEQQDSTAQRQNDSFGRNVRSSPSKLLQRIHDEFRYDEDDSEGRVVVIQDHHKKPEPMVPKSSAKKAGSRDNEDVDEDDFVDGGVSPLSQDDIGHTNTKKASSTSPSPARGTDHHMSNESYEKSVESKHVQLLSDDVYSLTVENDVLRRRNRELQDRLQTQIQQARAQEYLGRVSGTDAERMEPDGFQLPRRYFAASEERPKERAGAKLVVHDKSGDATQEQEEDDEANDQNTFVPTRLSPPRHQQPVEAPSHKSRKLIDALQRRVRELESESGGKQQELLVLQSDLRKLNKQRVASDLEARGLVREVESKDRQLEDLRDSLSRVSSLQPSPMRQRSDQQEDEGLGKKEKKKKERGDDVEGAEGRRTGEEDTDDEEEKAMQELLERQLEKQQEQTEEVRVASQKKGAEINDESLEVFTARVLRGKKEKHQQRQQHATTTSTGISSFSFASSSPSTNKDQRAHATSSTSPAAKALHELQERYSRLEHKVSGLEHDRSSLLRKLDDKTRQVEQQAIQQHMQRVATPRQQQQERSSTTATAVATDRGSGLNISGANARSASSPSSVYHSLPSPPGRTAAAASATQQEQRQQTSSLSSPAAVSTAMRLEEIYPEAEKPKQQEQPLWPQMQFVQYVPVATVPIPVQQQVQETTTARSISATSANNNMPSATTTTTATATSALMEIAHLESKHDSEVVQLRAKFLEEVSAERKRANQLALEAMHWKMENEELRAKIDDFTQHAVPCLEDLWDITATK